jgi:hypothetical protein
MQHTSGRWELAWGADKTPLVVAPAGSVAHVYMQRFSVSRGAKIEETDANARLIAAAPDLLAACSAYLADQAEARCTADSAAVKSMRAAVARATNGECAK